MASPRVGINFNRFKISKREALITSVVTFFSVFLAKMCDHYFGVDDYSLIFLTAVVYLASRFSMAVAVLAAAIFFISYDFFFLQPFNSFDVFAKQGIVTLLAFFISALIAGRLANRLRKKILELQKANHQTELLVKIGRQLSVALTSSEVIQTTESFLLEHLGITAQIELNESDTLFVTSAEEYNKKIKIQEGQTDKKDILSLDKGTSLPLISQDRMFGQIYIHKLGTGTKLNLERTFLELIIDYISQVLARTMLAEQLEEAKILAQAEHLRSTILSSISHDLRTPLASIKGAAETYKSYEAYLSADDKRTLMDTLQTESERLDQYIESLLNMTKLGNETIKLNKEWVGVDELIGAAVRRLKRYRPAQVIHIYLLEEECDLFVDAPLLEQAIFNILDNASKYSNYKNIEVHVHYQDHLEIAIHDEGYGFIDKEIPFVFDKFFRGEQSKNDKNGMGLGLSIVKAIMTAHESEIIISKSLVTFGSCVTLRFSQFEINAKGDIDG